MGLKGYRLWVMGQLDSTCRAPPLFEGASINPRRCKSSLKISMAPSSVLSGVRISCDMLATNVVLSWFECCSDRMCTLDAAVQVKFVKNKL
jgi:hypothetical protein